MMGMGHDGFGSDRLGRDGFGSATGSAATGSAAADAAGGPSMQFLLQLVKGFFTRRLLTRHFIQIGRVVDVRMEMTILNGCQLLNREIRTCSRAPGTVASCGLSPSLPCVRTPLSIRL